MRYPRYRIMRNMTNIISVRTAKLVAAILMAHCAGALADDDRERYNLRAARTDMALFHELDRNRTGLLRREDIAGDLHLGPRFDDIDVNRDGIVTSQEMRLYIERAYGSVGVASRERL
jgi:hypothetical protein